MESALLGDGLTRSTSYLAHYQVMRACWLTPSQYLVSREWDIKVVMNSIYTRYFRGQISASDSSW